MIRLYGNDFRQSDSEQWTRLNDFNKIAMDKRKMNAGKEDANLS